MLTRTQIHSISMATHPGISAAGEEPNVNPAGRSYALNNLKGHTRPTPP